MYGGTNNLGWNTACSSVHSPGNSADYGGPSCQSLGLGCESLRWDKQSACCVCVARCLTSCPSTPSLLPLCRAALCGISGSGKFNWDGVQTSNPAAVSWDLMCALHEIG